MEKFDHENNRIEKRAQFILDVLGLSWDELKGKKVVDIGAHTAELATAAHRHGVDMVALEMHMPPADVPENARQRYVIADARALPFGDEMFNIGLSHAALTIEPDVPESLHSTEEMLRVTNEEIRIAPLFVPEGSDPNDLPVFVFIKQHSPQAEIHLSPAHTNSSKETVGFLRAYVRIPKDSQSHH